MTPRRPAVAAALRLLPWLLVVAAFVVFLIAPGADGLDLILIWGAIVAVTRFGVWLLADWHFRLLVDGLFLAGCVLAAFEGGWYLLPAAGAFAICDYLDGRWTSGAAGGARGVVEQPTDR